MLPQARFFTCALCARFTLTCSFCDHGQAYCSQHCSAQARRQRGREAERRYRKSPKGQRNNAERQRRFRERQRLGSSRRATNTTPLPHASPEALPKKVTHQGSFLALKPVSYTRAPLSSLGRVKIGEPSSAQAPRCHFCARVCGSFFRVG